MPIHKVGSTSHASNYRPISLTRTCSKILEHIVSKHLLTYLDEHNLIVSCQHGFRKGLSTVTQLIELVHDLSSTVNTRGQTDIIFLDFAKAFDKVSHNKLLLKIDSTFKNSALTRWFSSYLARREQYVQLGHHQSGLSPVVSGVPQGSVLGPLLFLVFINDLPKNITTQIRMFADDCILYKNVKSPSDQAELNLNLERIKNWCDQWQMQLNPTKTVFMSISRKKNILSYPYSINGHELAQAKQYKYLGLIFTPDLRWNLHVEELCSKANKVLWGLRRNLHCASPEVKTLAYKTLLRPIIEYAKVVWDPYTQTNCLKLDIIQRLSSRFIFNKYRRFHSPTELCKLAELSPLQKRTEYERLKFLFIIIHNHVKISYDKYFEIKTQETSRHRHSMYIPPPKVHNDCFRYSFFPRAIQQWNSLPDSVVKIKSLTDFLEAIKHIVHSNTMP